MSKQLQGSAVVFDKYGEAHEADGRIVAITYDHLDRQAVTFHLGEGEDAAFSIIGVDALIAKLQEGARLSP